MLNIYVLILLVNTILILVAFFVMLKVSQKNLEFVTRALVAMAGKEDGLMKQEAVLRIVESEKKAENEKKKETKLFPEEELLS